MDGIKRYGFNDRPQMLFDSASSNEGYKNWEQDKVNAAAAKNMDEVSQVLKNLSPSQQAEVSSMWSQMRGASEYNIHGQRAIESMLSMRPNEDVVVFDIEALGTPTHMRKEGSAGYFSPTELALSKGKYMNGDIKLRGKAFDSLSILMKPNEETEQYLRNSISQLKKNGWRGLDADTSRSLVDLSAYSGDPNKILQRRRMGGAAYTHVLGHAQKVSGNASLAMPEVLARIESGLNNLVKHGTMSQDAIQVLDKFIPNKRGSQSPVRMVGYNIYNYDELALKEAFGGNLAKHAGNSNITRALGRLISGVTNTKNVDLFHALKTVEPNPYTKYGQQMTLTSAYDALAKKPRTGTAHYGLQDVEYTADIFGAVGRKVRNAQETVKGLNSASATVQDRMTAPFYWDKTPLKTGMELYSFNGLSAYNAGEYDGIFKKNAEGSLEKTYAMKQNPVYARTMYTVDRFLEDVTLGGKKYYGVQLTSAEGESHMLFRQTREELQKTVHGHFLPVSKYGIQKDIAMNLQNEDRGLRRYNKMFEIGNNNPLNTDPSDGFNLMKRMYGNLDEIKDMSWDAGAAKLKEKYKGQPWMTDAYLRDLKTIAPRLKAEEGLWKGFMKESGHLGTNAEKTIALHNFRGVLQENLGENKMFMATGGEPILSLQIGDKTSHLRGLDRNGMVQTIRRNVERGEGQVGKVGRETMINRFNELIENNLIPAFNNVGNRSMTREMRSIQKKFQQEVMANNKVSTIYEEVATMAGKYMNAAHSTSQGMEIERVSAVSAQYASRLKGFKPNKTQVQKAIDNVGFYGTNLETFLGTGEVKGFIDQQKKHAEQYLNMSGLPNATLSNYDNSVFSNVTKIDDKVKKLAQSYMNQGFRVQMFHNKERGLSMGIMDSKAPESLARSGYWGLRQSSNAAVIHLPGFAENGKIQWRGEQHLNRFVGRSNSRGQLSVGTVYDDVFDGLIKNAEHLRNQKTRAEVLGKKDFFINTQSGVDKTVRRILERSPMDYNKGYVEDDDMFKVRSSRANLNRSMYIDTSQLAEQWYREQHETLNPDQRKRFGMTKSYENIKSSMGYTDTFMDKMGFLAKARFNSEVDQWAENKWGLQSNAHGVNDRHMSKGYRSLVDPRRMSAFAPFDKTSGENRQKSLNYFPLEADNVDKVLKGSGETDAMVRLRTDYGVTTDFAKDSFAGEINGVSVRAAYMTDQQVSKSIADNRPKIDTELKKMLGNKQISMEEYNKYQQMLDNGQLSVYEGKAIMANKFKQVFDVVDDVRVRLDDGYELNGNIKKAMGAHAKKLGVKFDPNQSIQFDKPMSVADTQGLVGTDGRITVGSLMRDGKMIPQTHDAKSNKELFIKGWNAEEQMLIFGKHNRGEDSMKTVTNTGRRHIETFAPQEVLELVSGIKGTEAIMPHFGESKGMQGAVLEEKVRVYQDELIRQLHGASPQSTEVRSFIGKNGITVGDLAKNGEAFEGKIVRDLLLPKLQEHLGVDDKVIMERNGRVVVSHDFGFDSAQNEMGGGKIAASATAKLDKEMGSILNYEFRKNGVEVGQAIKQRHDVWADQYATGVGSEGRVRIGLKELGAIRQHLGSASPEGAQIVDFYQNQVHKMAKGGQETREIGQYIMNAMVNGSTPKAGDVVFDTSALRPETKDVLQGKQNVQVNARMGEGGVMYVNPDFVNPLPEITAKDTKILSDHYVGTMLDAGRLNVSYQGEDGKVVNTTVNDHLKAGGAEFKGTAYMKLPDASFGQEYMPLIDFQNIARKQGDGTFLNEMQRTQRNVIDNVNAYNNLGRSGTISPEMLLRERNHLQQRVSKDMSTLRQQTNQYMTGGSKGSFLSQTSNARLDMSGHFRAEGVNPFMQYSKGADGSWENTGNIKENVAYLNKHDVLDMISGAEDNIVDTWKKLDKDMTHPAFKDLASKQNFILENMNQKGIYGSAIRYPIIDASTIQTTKFEVGDWVGRKSMYMGTGAISRIAGDFDGDNLAAMITTYKSDKSDVYHKTLQSAYQKEAKTSTFRGNEVMQTLEKDMRGDLEKQGRSADEVNRIMSGLQSKDMYTVQDLAHAGFDQETIHGVIRAKTHAMDNVETVIARTGKEFIGHIDNARQRISTLHEITQRELVAGKAIGQQAAEESTQIVNEVTRRLSQDSISSKKFTVQTLINDDEFRTMTQEQQKAKTLELSRKRNEMLAQLREDLYNPNMDVHATFSNLKELGIVKDDKKTSLEIGTGREKLIRTMDDHALFKEGLSKIRDTNRMNQHVGGYNALALKAGASQGVEKFDEILQTGLGYVHTDAMKEYYQMANTETQARMDSHREAYRSGLMRLQQQNSDASKVMEELSSSTAPKIEGRNILQDNYIHQQAPARFRDVLDELVPKRAFGSPVAGSVAAGAVGFGAMWAASAALKTAPTPEGMREQQAQAGPRVPVDKLLTSPTARVTQNNGEHINLQISAKDAKNMSHSEVAALVNQELQGMSAVQMNMNLNVNDNSQNIDQKWVQDLVANAMNKGYAF